MPDESTGSLSLLNVFEVVTDGVHRHLICFVDPILAGARGIDARVVVGEFQPRDDGEFDPTTFVANPTFIEALTEYMNERTARSPEMAAEAARHASGMLYLIDPRSHATSLAGDEPVVHEVLGGFLVDETGSIVPDSFRYNDQHRFFDSSTGLSGVFADRGFYDWLNPAEG